MQVTGGALRRGSRALVAGILLAGLLAPVPAGAAPGGKPRVVVAVPDSATNPYHEFFHRGGPLYGNKRPSSVTPQVLREFGIKKSNIIKLTRTGDFLADFAKDKAKFDAIKEGEPYWFEGTNLIGISFNPQGQRLRPDGTSSAHGVGTTAAVLAANPDAIVVSIDSTSTRSEEWAFTHPAVDIVTTSYGPFTSVPTLTHLSYSYTGVVGNGKLHLGAAANDPTVAALDETAGPWWTIGVGGYEEGSSEGRQLLSGNLPDFLGDFTQDLPYCRNCEEGTTFVGGTSFATPRSAGTMSKILLLARRAARHQGGIVRLGSDGPVMVAGADPLSNWDLRRALEEGAYYPSAGDHSPGVSNYDATSTPIVDAAPWVQAGWGAISPDPEHRVIQQTLAHLGVKGKVERTKSSDACMYMSTVFTARYHYWNNFAPLGESSGTTEDPYIRC